MSAVAFHRGSVPPYAISTTSGLVPISVSMLTSPALVERRRDLLDAGKQLPKPWLLLGLERRRDDLVGGAHHQHHAVVGMPRIGDSIDARRNGDDTAGDVRYLTRSAETRSTVTWARLAASPRSAARAPGRPGQ